MGIFGRDRRELDFVSPTPKGGWRTAEGLPKNLNKHFASQTDIADSLDKRQTSSDAPLEESNCLEPGQRFDITTPQLFEEYCAEWARYLGFPDAKVTQYTQDGGVDIDSDTMIAQVKFQELPVGVRPIRELNGVKQEGQVVLFFSYSGFSPSAIKEARTMKMRLFRVSPFRGEIEEM